MRVRKLGFIAHRRSLWAEHLGSCAAPEYRDPASLECVRAINTIADANWAAYVQEDIVPMQGHLMTWPYQVCTSTLLSTPHAVRVVSHHL